MTQPGGGQHVVDVTLNSSGFTAGLAEMEARLANTIKVMTAQTARLNTQIGKTVNRPIVGQLSESAAIQATALARVSNAYLRTFGAAAKSANTATPAINRAAAATKRLSASMQGMAQHSENANKWLLRVGSAAQGMMIGTGILSRNITSIGFGLIFLRWAQLPLALLAAGFTVAAGAALGLASASSAAGIAFEASGQKMANFFRSGKVAMEIAQQADEISRRWGIPQSETTPLLASLQSQGMRSNTYIKGALNIAAAVPGATPSGVGADIAAVGRAPGEQRAAAATNFANKYQLPAANYTSTLQLMEAANERFGGSVEAMADTTQGKIGQMKAGWTSFIILVGTVMNAVIKPLFTPIIALMNGMIKGFGEAREAGDTTGDLSSAIEDLSRATARLAPYLERFGYLLGKVVYSALILTAKAVKVFIDALISLWQRLKPIIDILMSLLKLLKEWLDRIISLIIENKELVAVLAAVWLGMKLLDAILPGLSEKFKTSTGHITDFKNALQGIPPKTEIDVGVNTEGAEKASKSWGTSFGEGLRKFITTVLPGIFGGALIAAVATISGTVLLVAAIALAAALVLGLAVAFPRQAGVVGGFILGMIGTAIVAVILAPFYLLGLLAKLAELLIKGFMKSLVAIFTGDWDFFIKDVIPGALGALGGLFLKFFDPDGAVMKAFGKWLGLFIIGAIETIAPFVKLWGKMFEDITGGFGSWSSREGMIGKIHTVIDGLGDGLGAGLDKIRDGWDAAWEAIKYATMRLIGSWSGESGVIGIISEPFHEMQRGIGEIISGAGGIIDKIIGGFTDLREWFTSQAPAMSSAASVLGEAIADGLTSGIGGVIGTATDIGTRIVNMVIRAINYAIGQINRLIPHHITIDTILFGSQRIRILPDGFRIPDIPELDFGGVVSGPVGSKRLVLATAGERFGGNPSFDNARTHGMNGGGNNINIQVVVTDSVVTNDRAIDELTDKIATKIAGRLTINRLFSVHRP